MMFKKEFSIVLTRQNDIGNLTACLWTRTLPTLAVALLLLATSSRADEPSATNPALKAFAQPKTCFVQTAKASVRCGPGSQFYATKILELGATVDVYVETSDGWSGIRPPEGSHNWIPASSVYLLPGGKSAEVSVKSIAAFIGSDSSEIDSLLFQTTLVQSQKVSLMGEAHREEDGNKSLWFRIAPPQGEFRWIRTSQLGTDPVQPVTQAVAIKKGTDGTKPDANTTDNQVDDEVKLAAATVQVGDEEIIDGNVVWSDEAEQVARIEREIQREQAELAGEEFVDHDGGALHPKRAKTQQPTAYGQDAEYWNTLNGSDGQPLRVGPIRGVLGWLGFSIVEEAPHAGVIAHGPHPGEGALSRRGPYAPQSPLIESRLDRLPRPTRRVTDGSLWSLNQSQSSPLFGNGPLFGNDTQTEPPFEGDTFASDPDRAFANVPIAAANYRNPSLREMRDVSANPEHFQTQAIQDALIQLTAMVSKPTEQWNLEPFRVSAKSWIELGETPLIRGEARLLLDRIEEFESLRSRSMSIQSPPPLNATPLTEAVPPRVAGSGSEASGWLVSVVTSLPGQPEFALTDDAGKVLAYVRPTTGLNLRRYIQQPVTVYGAPGYIPNLAARQIIAERVVRLR